MTTFSSAADQMTAACDGAAAAAGSFFFQIQAPPLDVNDEHHHLLFPPLLPVANPQAFRAMAAARMFEKRSMSFSGVPDDGAGGMEEMNCVGIGGGVDDDLSDDCSLLAAGEKKIRRLSSEQVRTLERSFELGSKLDPDRKSQLARALGLQPRQIAIWFQNRRARWKTKQLERDFDSLRRQFEALRSENDALHTRNKELQAEVVAMKQGSVLRGGIDVEQPPFWACWTDQRGGFR